MKKNVEINNNLLTEDEILYLSELLKNRNDWKYKTYFDQPKQYFDSLYVDINKLKNYYELISESGKYEIIETGVVVIEKDRQLKNSIHEDSSDVSYITYLNEEFKGGEFVYYDEEKNEILITPKKNMTIIISHKTSHKVLEVTNGIRFSLYTFLKLSKKKLKSII